MVSSKATGSAVAPVGAAVPAKDEEILTAVETTTRETHLCGLPPWHLVRMCCTDMDLRAFPLHSIERHTFLQKQEAGADLSELAQGFLAWHRSVLISILPILVISSGLTVYDLIAEYSFGSMGLWFKNYFGKTAWAELAPAIDALSPLYWSSLVVSLLKAASQVAATVLTLMALRSWATLRQCARRAAIALCLWTGTPFLIEFIFPIAATVSVSAIQHPLCVNVFNQTLARFHSPRGGVSGTGVSHLPNQQLLISETCTLAVAQIDESGEVNVTVLVQELSSRTTPTGVPLLGSAGFSCDGFTTTTLPGYQPRGGHGGSTQGGQGGTPPGRRLTSPTPSAMDSLQSSLSSECAQPRVQATMAAFCSQHDDFNTPLDQATVLGLSQVCSTATASTHLWCLSHHAQIQAALAESSAPSPPAGAPSLRRSPSTSPSPRSSATCTGTVTRSATDCSTVSSSRMCGFTPGCYWDTDTTSTCTDVPSCSIVPPNVCTQVPGCVSSSLDDSPPDLGSEVTDLYCSFIQSASTSAARLSGTSSYAVFTQLRAAQISSVLTSILPTAASIAAAVGRAALVTKHIFPNSRLPGWLALLFILSGLPPLIALLALISQAISNVGVVITLVCYVVALIVWAPLGALPKLFRAAGVRSERASWTHKLSSSELKGPMKGPRVRDLMAAAAYRYWFWLIAAIVAIVVTLVLSLLTFSSRSQNWLANELVSWYTSLNAVAICNLINILLACVGKMYLALLVYANATMSFIMYVWRHNRSDEEAVQGDREQECAELMALYDEDADEDELASMRGLANQDGAAPVAI